jgi:proline dehydrogenase
LVTRFIAGDDASAAVRATASLAARGFLTTIDYLGEDVTTRTQATATRDAYTTLLERIADEGLDPGAEVSVKLSALGQALREDGESIALENAHAICAAARRAGTTVTLDMEDHTTVDSTLRVVQALRADYSFVGAVLQSCLLRTESDARTLAGPGSRIRLVKGAYAEPRSVAYSRKSEVDAAYLRCLEILVSSGAYPMVATHDQVMINEANRLAGVYGLQSGDYELQMLYGIRTGEQERQVAQGRQVRVYLPCGEDWYGYFMRRLAERPANLGFFVRGLLTR